MLMRAVLLAVCGLLPCTLFAQITFQNAFTGISFSGSPVDLQAPPDGTDRLFVVERSGSIYIINDIFGTPAKLATPFLTISDPQFVFGGERGLLGLAFHPNYTTNGFFYVFFTVNPSGPINTRTVVSRFKVSAGNPNLADAASELKMIGVDHDYGNHNAGQLQFGPDGYLYVGMGDGGSRGDPDDNAQDKTKLLGSMLRLDVDIPDGDPPATPSCSDITAYYNIPPGNPFADGAGGDCDEIWAFGLRNPWRFSFGPDGKLWVGDVGQNAYEEISLLTVGGNFGWDVHEGDGHCYDSDPWEVPCGDPSLIEPIWEYNHPGGASRSITGGYVYSGTACGAVSGQYLYSDYVTREAWALNYDANENVTNTPLPDSPSNLSSFGMDRLGEQYTVALSGTLRKLDCSALTGVSLKAFLAGPYDTGADAMETTLNANGHLPLIQPYNTALFDGTLAEHDNQENLDDDFLTAQPDVVDWVAVELRTGTDAASAVAKRAALIQSNGMVTDFDGGPVRFLGVAAGSYYVALHHRNHLSIMTPSALTLNATPALHDFTTAQTQAFGTNPMLELETGVFGMYGGDGNAIDGVTAFDFLNIWLPQNGTVGYLQGDFNLSGDATAFDFLTVWLPGNGQASRVPG